MESSSERKKLKSFKVIQNHLARPGPYYCLRLLFKKIKNGCPLTNIPTEPDNFLARIQRVKRGELKSDSIIKKHTQHLHQIQLSRNAHNT